MRRPNIVKKRKRPRARIIPPVAHVMGLGSAMLMSAALLILFPGIMLVAQDQRGDILLLFIFTELLGSLFFLAWLFQAWRAVSTGREEHSPWMMVVLLAVPVFNLYWFSRATVGLSIALQEQLEKVEPSREIDAGEEAGKMACIFLFLPFAQPIGLVVLIGWVLLVNNAIKRLTRIHTELRAKQEAEKRNTRQS